MIVEQYEMIGDRKAYMPSRPLLKRVLDKECETREIINNLDEIINIIHFDKVKKNRDWAVFILQQSDLDTPKIRKALLLATKDKDTDVRGEAMLALAKLDPHSIISIVHDEFQRDHFSITVIEAAEVISSPLLLEDLKQLKTLNVDNDVIEALDLAIVSCS